MTHPRAEIRDHVVALLSTTDLPVVPSRVYPIQRTELPAICVYTLNEISEQESLTPPRMMRDLQLAIDLYATGADGAPDDALDALAETIEALMAADIRLGGRAFNSFLAETSIGFDGAGEQARGLARLRYTVRYRTP